jgi:hypothetical protein
MWGMGKRLRTSVMAVAMVASGLIASDSFVCGEKVRWLLYK